MSLGESFETLGGGYDAHELDLFPAALFYEIYRVYRGASGGEHGIGYDDDPFIDRTGKLAVI